jgi:hypothetical protein
MRAYAAAALAAALAAASWGGAYAQQGSNDSRRSSGMMMGSMAACPMGMGGSGMMAGQGAMGPGMMGGMHRDAAGAVTQLDKLRGELAIRPEQQGAWDAYAQAANGDAQVMNTMHSSMTTFMQRGSKTAPDWLSAHRSMMRTRMDSLDSLAGAVDALYGRLDDSQKAIFDKAGGGLCQSW